MNKKNAPRGLGRGLNDLFGIEDNTPSADPVSTETVREIPILLIDVNHDQPRKNFDQESLAELADSIRSVGILQPLIACEQEGRYTIIAGERRFRAARMAGLESVPVIVRDYDVQKRMEAALIENLQRSDLNPIEAAEGIRSLIETSSLTQDDVARQLGMSRPAVTNALRLLTLPDSIREMLKSGQLTAGHARALVGLDKTRQIQLANLAVAQHWSVRQLEKICASPEPEKPEPKQPKDVQLARLETMARDVFGTRVRLDGTQDKGKITISYYHAEDLGRIWDVLESLGKDS